MFPRNLGIALVVCLASLLGVAQDIAPPAPQRLAVHSNVLNEDRVIWVRMPEVSRLENNRYSVLYLLDGKEQINEISTIVDFLVSTNRMPPMIVVGIQNNDRDRDLTPTHADIKDAKGVVENKIPTSGGGDKFLDFIQTELIPEIEKRYSTQPFRVFAGHSLGGLMVVHTLITRPELFNAYIAVSPSLWWDDKHLLRQAEQFFASQKELKKTLFLSLGDEPGRQSDAFEELVKKLKAGAPKGFVWDSARYMDEDHVSIVLVSHYAGLRKIFTGFQVTRNPETGLPNGGLAEVEQHYRELSERYGFPISAEKAIDNLGYRLLARQQLEQAVQAFKRNVELYPDSPQAYNSLAEAYVNQNRFDLAVQNLRKAVELATSKGNPRLPEFQTNLDEIVAAVKTSPEKAGAPK